MNDSRNASTMASIAEAWLRQAGYEFSTPKDRKTHAGIYQFMIDDPTGAYQSTIAVDQNRQLLEVTVCSEILIKPIRRSEIGRVLAWANGQIDHGQFALPENGPLQFQARVEGAHVKMLPSLIDGMVRSAMGAFHRFGGEIGLVALWGHTVEEACALALEGRASAMDDQDPRVI